MTAGSGVNGVYELSVMKALYVEWGGWAAWGEWAAWGTYRRSQIVQCDGTASLVLDDAILSSSASPVPPEK